MAGPLIGDRVSQVTTSTGTGTLSLDPTLADTLQSFSSAIGDGNEAFYCISHQSANEWEVGVGTVGSGTLSRDTVLSSSNGDNLVNFSAGTKDVFSLAPAVYGTPLIAVQTTHALRRMDETSLSSTVGNARGNGANDLQSLRSAANQVANGNYSAILGGRNNLTSGSNSWCAGGRGHVTNNANTTVFGGRNTTANQNYATALGGYNNTPGGGQSSVVVGGSGNSTNSGASTVLGGIANAAGTGGNVTIIGGDTNTAGGAGFITAMGTRANGAKRGQVAHSGGRFSSNGDAQTSHYVSRRATTNATPAELFLDGSSARITLGNDTTYAFKVLVVARRTNANDESAAYLLEGCIDRNAAANTTALVGSVTKTVIAEDTAAWDVSVTADTTNGALIITVTGEAAKNINWVAFTRTTEVTG